MQDRTVGEGNTTGQTCGQSFRSEHKHISHLKLRQGHAPEAALDEELAQGRRLGLGQGGVTLLQLSAQL